MKVSDAKKLECRQVAPTVTDDPVLGQTTEYARCSADKCMAWRWRISGDPDAWRNAMDVARSRCDATTGGGLIGYAMSHPQQCGLSSKTEGYCGIAGKE